MKYFNNIIAVLLTTVLFSCTPKQPDNSIDKKIETDIKAAFDNWAETEMQKGVFFAIDSCNWDYYVMRDSLGLETVSGFAIPNDSSEIHYYYADLNGDNKKDALITFTPCQCDGGNSAMWVQYQLLVLSQGDKYFVIDNYFEKYETGSVFFHLDSVAPNTVFGTCFEFTDNDARCCPSIQRPIKINLDKNEIDWKIVVENDKITDRNLAKRKGIKIPEDAVKGDFNGDGILDYAWLVAPKIDNDGMDCVGNCISYIKFSDPTIPMIKVNDCIGGIPDNLGDLNKDGTDEIGLLPWWFTSCWGSYYVWTLKNNKWRYAVEPFSTHCNQWDEGVTPIEIDLSKNGFVLIRYSELTDEDIVTKTKSVPLK